MKRILLIFSLIFGLCLASCASDSQQPDSQEAQGSGDHFDYHDVVMEYVDSSMISRIGYSGSYNILVVEFRNSGDIYAYYDVPFTEYDNLITSDSIGSYFTRWIKDNFEYEKLADGAETYTPIFTVVDSAEEASYVVNIGTGKYHLPACRYVKEMNENMLYTSDSKDFLDSLGYVGCKVCNP